MVQNRALIERSLVSDLAFVETRRLLHHDQAHDPRGRSAGLFLMKRQLDCQSRAESKMSNGLLDSQSLLLDGDELTKRGHIWHDECAELRPVFPRNHRIADQAAELIDKLRPQRANCHPGSRL